jgi:hypothetical protein
VIGGTTAPTRLVGLDRARGLAIALMVLDHVLVVIDGPALVRLTVTRAALPLFALLIGALWRPGLRWRHVELIAAAVAASVLGPLAGLTATPDVLVVIAVALLLMPLAVRAPIPVLAASIIAPVTWPEAHTGYSVAVVLALILTGYLLRWKIRDGVEHTSLPAWLAVVGRYPLTWYLGHLTVLAALRAVL